MTTQTAVEEQTAQIVALKDSVDALLASVTGITTRANDAVTNAEGIVTANADLSAAIAAANAAVAAATAAAGNVTDTVNAAATNAATAVQTDFAGQLAAAQALVEAAQAQIDALDGVGGGSGLGYDPAATLRDVTTSRVSGAVYRNSTAYMADIHGQLDASVSAKVEISTDNIAWLTVATGAGNVALPFGRYTIPPQHYYRVTSAALLFEVAGALADFVEVDGVDPAEPVDVSFDGVTATFDGVTASGTYIDGTPWVTGGGAAVTLTALTPETTTADRTLAAGGTTGVTTVHGAMLNPGNAALHGVAGDKSALIGKQQFNFGHSGGTEGQGYDSYVVSTNLAYDATRNLSLPQSMTEGTIVKARSTLSAVAASGRPSLDALVPVTVVSSAPAAQAFRPAPALASKASLWTLADVRMDYLPNMDAAGIDVPDYATMLAQLKFVSWQHTYNSNSRNIQVAGAPIYGGDRDVYTDAMIGLCYDTWSAAQKQEIAVRLIQMGIDIAGRVEEGAIYTPNGGHDGGYKVLVAFAARMLGDDPTLTAILGTTALGTNYNSPATPVGTSIWSDDQKVFTITQEIIDASQAEVLPYTQDQLGWPEWGGDGIYSGASAILNHLGEGLDATLDPTNNDVYRFVSAKVICGGALALRLIGARTLFGNQTYFDYADRYMGLRIANGGQLSTANDVTPLTLQAWQDARGTDGLWTAQPAVVAAVLGQSENNIGLFHAGDFIDGSNADFYSAGPYPAAPIPAGTAISFVTTSTDDDAANAVVRHVTQANSDAKQIGPGMHAAALLWRHVTGNRPLMIIDNCQSGTGMAAMMDDADTDRSFANDRAMADFAVARFGHPTQVDYIWYNSEASVAKTLQASRFPHVFGLNGDGSNYDFSQAGPDHSVFDVQGLGNALYDGVATFNLMLPGPRVFTATDLIDPPHVNYLYKSDLSRNDGMTYQNGAPAIAARKAFAAASPLAYRGQATITPSVCQFGDYTDGVKHTGSAQSSIHPAMQSAYGQQLYAQHIAAHWLITNGYTTAPVVDRWEFASDGSYADMIVSLPVGMTLTTIRKTEAEAVASPRPHQQEVIGFEIARGGEGATSQRPLFRTDATTYPAAYRGSAVIHDSGSDNGGAWEAVVRITPEEPFVNSDVIYFGWDGGYPNCQLAGYPDYDAHLFKDALVAQSADWYAATGYFGMPVEPQASGTASGIVVTEPAGPETFTLTGTGPYFIDTAGIGSNVTRLEWSARIRLLGGTNCKIFTQVSLGCDLDVIGGSGLMRLNVEGGTGATLLSSTGNGSSMGTIPFGTWVDVGLDVDWVAGYGAVSLDGVEVARVTFTAAAPYAQPGRQLGFLGMSTAASLPPSGTQVEWVEVYKTVSGTRSLHKRIAGNAATVNADPWKQGTSAT